MLNILGVNHVKKDSSDHDDVTLAIWAAVGNMTSNNNPKVIKKLLPDNTIYHSSYSNLLNFENNCPESFV